MVDSSLRATSPLPQRRNGQHATIRPRAQTPTIQWDETRWNDPVQHLQQPAVLTLSVALKVRSLYAANG